jgi:FdhD protein
VVIDGMLPPARNGTRARTRLLTHDRAGEHERVDVVAVEEPLEIRLAAADGRTRQLAVTMRTPGNDFELAAGFLLGEGIIADRARIRRIAYCTGSDVPVEQRYNVVTVTLDSAELPDTRLVDRNVTTTSACGVCGRTSIESLAMRGTPTVTDRGTVHPDVIRALPSRLRAAQPVFDRTGGLHAAALFEPDGDLLAVREDVGRHNALDKLTGWALLEQRVPLSGRIVVVSGRASYELVQKSVTVGASVLCAISAPSSLAVDLARAFDLTLIGFLRDERFNVYAGAARVGPAPTPGC